MGDSGGDPDRLSVPRFFVKPTAATAERVAFEADQSHQIRRVLRMRSGDPIIVCDGTGDEIRAEIRFDGKDVWAIPIERRPGRRPPSRSVWLYPSALRGDRFTWLLQKVTEIGVAGVVPVLYAHTQPADYAARQARHTAVVREAAEQSERTILPELASPTTYAEALSQCAPDREICLLLDERERTRSLNADLTRAGAVVRIFVGPEGGLTDRERALAVSKGLTPVSLGQAILRSETAGMVGVALALSASNDLG
jgi:16S rRNA (uracil1498-N3)-methyltransferase